MSCIAVFAGLARYNAWANEKLFTVCAALDEAARRRDAGLFFRSVHGTLNHLLLADRIWLGRLTGAPLTGVTSLADELYADFDELWHERRETDAALSDYVASLEEGTLAGELRYRSLETGSERCYPMTAVLSHLFNHQTHHRGQVTAVIGQLGVDYGALDLIWMPVASSEPVD